MMSRQRAAFRLSPHTMEAKSPTQILPRALWLWMAPSFVVFELGFHAVWPDIYKPWCGGELGLIEGLTNIFAIVGLVTAVRLFFRRQAVASRYFGPCMLVLAAGCLVFAGEEMSWGQHWFGFAVPEAIAQRNDQQEFNLHNDPLLEPLFDFWARNFLSWCALIGGVILPIVRHRAGRGTPDLQSPRVWGWIVPTLICLPTAITVCLVTLPPRIFLLSDIPPPYPYFFQIAWSETKEFHLALLVMIYLLTLLHYVPRRAS